MTSLTISTNLVLPIDACTQTFAILAKRGVGKTYTANVMAEEMLAANMHIVIADPVGVWWGLRSSADGKKPGLPIVVFGGDHADLPLQSTAGTIIADLIIQERIQAVLDLSLFRKGEQTRFMTDFCERLYQKNRDPLHFMIDEADAFAPQRTMPGEQRMLGAVEDIIRRGRARGLGATLITQRAAVLNKNVLTQIEVLIALRTISPQDRAAIDAWIQVHGTPEQRKELMESLPSLPIGTAWFWSPGWLDMFKRVKVRQRRTFDSSSTPKVGQQIVAPKAFAPVDLERISAHIADSIEAVKQSDPAALRRRIASLENEVVRLTKRAETAELRASKQASITTPQEPVPATLSPALRKALTKMVDLATTQLLTDGMVVGYRDLAEQHDVNSGTKNRRQGMQATLRPAPRPAASVDGLRKGAVRILQELAARYPAGYSKPQVGALTRFSHKGGTFNTYLSDLRRNGFIEERSGLLYASTAGVESLGDQLPATPKTHTEAMEQWRNALRAGAFAMLEAIASSGANGISRDQLAEHVGMTRTGGTFNTYLSDLRRNGLITDNGGVCIANDILFPGDA